MSSRRWLALGLIVAAACAFTKTVDDGLGRFKYRAEEERPDKYTTVQHVRIEFQLKSAECHCSEVTYIQSVLATDSSGRHIAPEAEHRARMDPATGWAVDKLPGGMEPWYPVDNDGSYSPNFGGPGSNGTPAWLKDDPTLTDSRWPIKVEAISCAICRDGAESCINRVLGCLYWTFTVDKDGKVGSVDARQATAQDRANAKASHAGWNVAAGALGKTPIPALGW